MIAHSHDYPVPLHQSAGTWWFNLNVELIPGEPAREGEPERPASYRYDSVPLPGEPERAAMIAAGIGARYTPDAEIALLNKHQLGYDAGWADYQAYRTAVKAAVTAAGYPSENAEPVTRVTHRQACLALREAGLLAQIPAIIAGIADADAREIVQIEWDSRCDVDRTHPWVQSLAAALGLTAEALDALFEQAATL